MTSSKTTSPPHSPSKEQKEEEDEEEGGGEGGGEETDRTSSEGLKKDERTKEQMEVGEEKIGEKEDEVEILFKTSRDFFSPFFPDIVIVTVNISINDNVGYLIDCVLLLLLVLHQHGGQHGQNVQVTDCVPDSSNAVEAEEEADDEQHSSGSVDEVSHDDYDNDDVYNDDKGGFEEQHRW